MKAIATDTGHVRITNPDARAQLRLLVESCHIALNAAKDDGLAYKDGTGYSETVERLLGSYVDDMVRCLLPVMGRMEAHALADSLVVAAHDVAARMREAS